MYRKALTIAAIILSAFVMTAMTYHGDSQGWNTISQHKDPGMNAKMQVGTASNPPSFSQADTDHNSLIDPNEANAIGIPFAVLDADHDGVVTRYEYNAATAHYNHRSAIELHQKPG
jgi:ABC-type antimicrobial peptide transport system permease subunit